MGIPLLLLLAVTAPSTEIDVDEAYLSPSPRNSVRFAGSGGLSVGLPVLGWVGTAVRYDRLLGEKGYVGVQAGLAVGIGMPRGERADRL